MLVLAIGAGSVFFSHLNDAGFWLVKEYFGMTVGQTLKTWSLMETILSVTGLVASCCFRWCFDATLRTRIAIAIRAHHI